MALVAAGLAGGVSFVRRQRRLEKPMLDVDLFRSAAISGSVAANVISIFALTGPLFFFSQYLQLARGNSPLQAGLAELPVTIALVAVVAIIGVTAARLGRGRAIALGLVLSAAKAGADSGGRTGCTCGWVSRSCPSAWVSGWQWR